MKSHYREDKAIEVASLLLKREGGEMNHTKLIKLMYIIEREAILRWGFPVTCDDYYSLDRGPILSHTLDNIKGKTGSKAWEDYISREGEYNIRLKVESKIEKLNRAEIKLVNEIYDRFGGMTGSDLIEWSQNPENVPEWENPHGSILPIKIETILRKENFPEDEIVEIMEEIETSRSIRELLAI